MSDFFLPFLVKNHSSTPLSIILFLNKVIIPQDLHFQLFFFSCFSRHLGIAYSYRCFDETFVCCRRDATFICVREIQTNKVYPISDKKSNQLSLIYCRTRIINIIVTIVIYRLNYQMYKF